MTFKNQEIPIRKRPKKIQKEVFITDKNENQQEVVIQFKQIRSQKKPISLKYMKA